MRILMYGPSRKVMGGISSVVNGYYEQWNEDYDLTYVGTMEDGSNLKKAFVFLIAYISSIFIMPSYDIVHVHMASKNSYERKNLLLKMAKFYKKKTIIHVHGSNFMLFYGEDSSPVKRAKIRKTFNEADYVIALSARWEEDLATITKTPIQVIYNAVSCPPPYEKVLNNNICFLGRLGPRKGVFDLMDVLVKLNKSYKDYQVYIGGDGDVEGLKKYISDHNMTNVHYVGWISGRDKERLLRDTTIFSLPSYHEGLPMALLEAMSYGCVSISTTVGGIPEVLRNGENGFIMEPGDKETLYTVLDDILSGRVDKGLISKNARETIEVDHSLAVSLQVLYNLYDVVNG